MPDTKRLITWQRVAADGQSYDILYPRTVASQVFYDETNGKTVADHITDAEHIHLTAAERTALDATNGANGYLKLDSSGYVPSANLNPAHIAIHTEFADITALLAADPAQIAVGQIVMVLDASGDPTVSTASTWAIYRRKANTTVLTTLDSWQKIAEQESLDVVVQWANIQGKPNSTPAAIDQAVTDDHTHANKAVLDELADTGTAQAPVLEYKGEALAFSKDNTTFTLVETGGTVPAASTLKAGDFVFVQTA